MKYRKGERLFEIKRFIVSIKDLTGIDFGVTGATFTVYAESPAAAEDYVQGFCKKSQMTCFEISRITEVVS